MGIFEAFLYTLKKTSCRESIQIFQEVVEKLFCFNLKFVLYSKRNLEFARVGYEYIQCKENLGGPGIKAKNVLFM